MKRFNLMHKSIPTAEDGFQLGLIGVKILNTLFEGTLLIVEGPDDLKSRLFGDRWVVDEDRGVKAIITECQVPIGADDICGLPPDSQIHTNRSNPQRHDFVARINETV